SGHANGPAGRGRVVFPVACRGSRWERFAGLRTRLGGVGATHPATALGRAFVFVEAAPRAVLLGPGDRVVQALRADGAAHADLLRLALTDLPLGLALTVGTEEEDEVFPPARRGVLPAPAGTREVCLPTYLSHGTPTLIGFEQFQDKDARHPSDDMKPEAPNGPTSGVAALFPARLRRKPGDVRRETLEWGLREITRVPPC